MSSYFAFGLRVSFHKSDNQWVGAKILTFRDTKDERTRSVQGRVTKTLSVKSHKKF